MAESRVGAGVYELRVDTAKLNAGAKDAVTILQKSGKAGEAAFSASAKGADKLAASQGLLSRQSAELKKGILGGVGLGGGLVAFNAAMGAISGVADALGSAQKAASDMAEAQAKVGEVFDTTAGEIRVWATDSARSMGISQRAALESAGTFGNFLQAMGQAEPKAAEMSKAMVQLAADMGSFNNEDPTAVLNALRSGLSGEAEPLKKFGVALSDAAVKAELAAMGIEAVNGAFSEGDKIQARYNIIMRQTAKAHGDFARNASGSANQAKTLDAMVEDLNAKVGVFADEIIRAAQGLAIDLVGGIEDVGRAFHNLQRFLDPMGAEIEDIRTNIVAMAKARGLDEEAALAAYDAHRKETQASEELAAIQKELARIEARAVIRAPLFVRQLERRRDELLGVADAEDEVADAVVAHGDKALAFLDDYEESGTATYRKVAEEAGKTAEATGELAAAEKEAGLVAVAAALWRKKAAADEAAADERAIALKQQLARAIEHVATTSFPDLRDAAREAQKAIQAAFKDQGKPLAALAREEARLMRQRKRAMAEGRFDIVAMIDTRLADVRAAEAARRTTNQHYRQERREQAQRKADLDTIQQKFKVTRQRAIDLWKAAGRTVPMKLKVDDSELDSALRKVQTLNSETAAAAYRERRRQMGQPTAGGKKGKRKDGAGGATYYPGDYGYVGEVAMERIRNVGGVTVVEPIAGAGRAQSSSVVQNIRQGDTVVNLSTYGQPIRARTPMEVVRQLDRLGRMGEIAPRRQPAWGKR